MAGKRRRPWLAVLLLADGLTAAVGGPKLLHQLRSVAPFSLQVALDGLLEVPESWYRLAGAGEALLGAVLLATWFREEAPAPAATLPSAEE